MGLKTLEGQSRGGVTGGEEGVVGRDLIISPEPFSKLQDESLGNQFPRLGELSIEYGHHGRIDMGESW